MIAKVRRVENKQKGNLERERNFWQDRNQSKEISWPIFDTTLVILKGGYHMNIALLFVPIKKENSYLVVFFLEVLNENFSCTVAVKQI